MNRLYIYSNEFVKDSDSEYIICDQKRILHLKKILKKEVNSILKIVLINKGIGQATLLEINNKQIRLKIHDIKKGHEKKIHLLIALCRPPSIKKIIEHGTTLGVSSFSFFPATHSEKSYVNSHIFKKENLQELLALGVAQSGVYYKLPRVKILNNLSEFLQTQFLNKYFYSLKSSKNFLNLQIEQQQQTLLAIGPERGWTTSEEENFINLGFKSLNLGKAILRTEIAVFVALAPFQHIQ